MIGGRLNGSKNKPEQHLNLRYHFQNCEGHNEVNSEEQHWRLEARLRS